MRCSKHLLQFRLVQSVEYVCIVFEEVLQGSSTRPLVQAIQVLLVIRPSTNEILLCDVYLPMKGWKRHRRRYRESRMRVFES
jgi:hypothetical protein